MTLPNFLYIGTSRAGSTWLYEALAAHPEIYVPGAKDIFFFDRMYDRGLHWYEGFFPKNTTQYQAIGELSHDYFHTMEYARRIKTSLPGVRLMACLREPGSQTISAYGWWCTHGGFEGSYADFVETDQGYQPVNYYENLKNYFALFPSEALYITFFDKLKNSPQSFIHDIYQFLDVDANFIPPNLNQSSNAFAKPRNSLLTSFAYTAGQVVRRIGLGNLVGMIKHNPVTRALLYSPAEHNALTENDQKALTNLRARCQVWYPALEDLLQEPLPPDWYRHDSADGPDS